MTTADLSLHLVTADSMPLERLCRLVDSAIAGGVTVVQLRRKRASAREMCAEAVALSEVVAGRALFVVNDRLDVVLAAKVAGARVDGVHLGQDDIPPEAARRILGPGSLIGWSANTPEHLERVAAMPAGTLDYLGVGAIRSTDSKPDHPVPLGVAGFGSFARQATLPCVAIGGVVAGDVVPLRQAGAAGVAVISAICAAADPQAAARQFTAGAGSPHATTGTSR